MENSDYLLLPQVSSPDDFIAPHIWRDSNYLGLQNGKVVVWRGYTQFCRELGERASVYMRTLDQALWQYSKENQK